MHGCRIALFSVLFLVQLHGQTNNDSLAQTWADETLADSQRLEAIHRLAWNQLYSNPDSFFQLINQQMAFAQSNGHRWWEARALNSTGVYHYLIGEYAKAFSYYQKSLDRFLELGDEKRAAALYANMGLIYRDQGNNLAALEYQQKAFAINEKLRDTAAMSGDFINLANLYQDRGDVGKALEYYDRSLQLKKNPDKDDLGLIYNNIGALYAGIESEYPKALIFYQKSLKIREEIGDKVGMAVNYHNIGQLYSKMGELEKGIEYTQKAIQLHEILGDKNGVANSLYILGEIALQKKDYGQAAAWCKESLDLSRAFSALPVERRACYCLYLTYKGAGQPAKALGFHEEFKLLTDSLREEELEIKLNQFEFQKEVLADSLTREEENLKVQLAHQAELRQKDQDQNMILIGTLVLLVIALAFLSRMLYFQRSSEKFQSKAEKLEKQKLLGEIALLKTQINPHFLFNSLSILSSLVHADPDLSEKFIDQLSESYRYILEQRDQSLVTLRTELEFIYSYAFLLKIRFENKFDILYDIPENHLDRHKIAPLTLQLLIENAVKHNKMSVKEPLHIRVGIEEGMLLVQNQLQPRTTSSPSTGMGLENIRNSYALLSNRSVWAGPMEGNFIVKVPLV